MDQFTVCNVTGLDFIKHQMSEKGSCKDVKAAEEQDISIISMWSSIEQESEH